MARRYVVSVRVTIDQDDDHLLEVDERVQRILDGTNEFVDVVIDDVGFAGQA